MPEVIEKRKAGKPRIHDNPKAAKKIYDIEYMKQRYLTDPEFRELQKLEQRNIIN